MSISFFLISVVIIAGCLAYVVVTTKKDPFKVFVVLMLLILLILLTISVSNNTCHF